MLVAILSDIHGNMEALNAVWADLEEFPVSSILCLGDMIGYGPDPEDVLCSVRARGALCCMGNHELGIVSAEERAWFNSTSRKGLGLTERLLSADSLDYIAKLPRSIDLEGARFVHGFPPDSVTTYLFQVDEARLAGWFELGAKMTFVGHTHELMLVQWRGSEAETRELVQETFVPDGPCIINAGSVGQPRDGNNNAKFLLWDTERRTVEVRFVPYDIGRTVAKIRERGFPEFYGSRLW